MCQRFHCAELILNASGGALTVLSPLSPLFVISVSFTKRYNFDFAIRYPFKFHSINTRIINEWMKAFKSIVMWTMEYGYVSCIGQWAMNNQFMNQSNDRMLNDGIINFISSTKGEKKERKKIRNFICDVALRIRFWHKQWHNDI